MALTPRFGFRRIGGDDGDTLSTNGYQFGDADRLLIDRLLAALETHDHTGGTRLDDPTEVPGLSQLDVGGALQGGTTFYYRVGFVDAFGLETAGSPEASIITPGQVAPPAAPVGESQATGTLTAGNYYYALTAVKDGAETPLGSAAVVTVQAGHGSVLLTLPTLPTGATGFGIWRWSPTASYYTRIADDAGGTYVDNGSIPDDPCPTDPDALPPAGNLTNSTNMVTVETPDPAIVETDPSAVKKWRIYRTTTSGFYGPSSLVAEISDLDPGLVTTYDDVGAALTVGAPKEVSQTLTPSTQVEGDGGASILLLADDDDVVWRVVTDEDGALVTRVSGAAVPDSDTWVMDADGVNWLLGVEIDGTLSTTVGTPVTGDAVYDEGSAIPSPDATVDYLLTVDTAGALVTTLL